LAAALATFSISAKVTESGVPLAFLETLNEAHLKGSPGFWSLPDGFTWPPWMAAPLFRTQRALCRSSLGLLRLSALRTILSSVQKVFDVGRVRLIGENNAWQ